MTSNVRTPENDHLANRLAALEGLHSRYWHASGLVLSSMVSNRQDIIQSSAGCSRMDSMTSANSMALQPVVWHAEALVQAMIAGSMESQVFSLCSTEGAGPGQDSSKWQALFEKCCRQQQIA